MKSFQSFLDTISECKDCCDCEQCDEVTVFEDEEGNEYFLDDSEDNLEESYEIITELQRKIRITSRGARIRRIKCPPGRVLKTINGRKVCVVPTGTQKLKKRLAIRKANRTKRARGANYQRRISFRRSRAMKRRKSMGLRKGQ